MPPTITKQHITIKLSTWLCVTLAVTNNGTPYKTSAHFRHRVCVCEVLRDHSGNGCNQREVSLQYNVFSYCLNNIHLMINPVWTLSTPPLASIALRANGVFCTQKIQLSKQSIIYRYVHHLVLLCMLLLYYRFMGDTLNHILHNWQDVSLMIRHHNNDVITNAMASHITNLTIVYSSIYSGADQRNRQSSASLAFVRGIYQWPVNSPHKGPVMRKMFPFDDVIMS